MSRPRGRWWGHRVFAVLGALVVIGATGCGGGKGGGGGSPAPHVAGPPVALPLITATVEDPPAPPGPGEPPMGRPLISAITWTSKGYRAAGTDGLRFVVWGSTDGAEWKVVDSESHPCCAYYETAVQLFPFGDRLIAVSRGQIRQSSTGSAKDLVDAAFLRSSTNDGASWTDRPGGPFSSPGMRVDTVDVVGSTILVSAITEESDLKLRPSLWRSTDLVTWQQLELPGAPALGFRTVFAAPDGSLSAVATNFDNSNAQTWFRSTDDGASFIAVTGPAGNATLLGRAGGRLIARLQSSGEPDAPQSDPVIATTKDGATWDVQPRNTGVFGDGQADPGRPASTSDAAYMLAGRTLRQDDRYCFDDITTCEQRARVLLAIGDGATFAPVNVGVDPVVRDLVAGDDGSLLLWSDGLGTGIAPGPVLQLQRWAGPDAPATTTADPLPPPSDPSPVLVNNYDSVNVGDSFRSRRAIGACGANELSAGGRIYIDANPPQPPYPASWPFKKFEGSDGPTGWVFVKGQRVDENTFRFFVDAQTTLDYVFTPTPPQGPYCG